MIRRLAGFAGIVAALVAMNVALPDAALIWLALLAWAVLIVFVIPRRPHLILMDKVSGRAFCRDCGPNCTARIPQVTR